MAEAVVVAVKVCEEILRNLLGVVQVGRVQPGFQILHETIRKGKGSALSLFHLSRRGLRRGKVLLTRP
eukprot:6463326-Amphidinium_carterae.1